MKIARLTDTLVTDIPSKYVQKISKKNWRGGTQNFPNMMLSNYASEVSEKKNNVVIFLLIWGGKQAKTSQVSQLKATDFPVEISVVKLFGGGSPLSVRSRITVISKELDSL